MSKFNLKTYEKIDGDEHIERRLRVDHSEAPNEINESQLEDGRVDESEVLIEKLLEKKRTGYGESLIEKLLEDSSSKLVQHRNSETSAGDINKLEEQRLANEPEEEEEYDLASETPKAFKWWQKNESGDKLKLAQSNFSPARELFEETDSRDTSSVYEMPDIMERDDVDELSPEEELINDVPGFSEFSIDDETEGGDVWISEEHPMGQGSGFEIVIGFEPSAFAGDAESLEREIMSLIESKHPELEDVLNADSLTIGDGEAFLSVQDVDAFPLVDELDELDDDISISTRFEEMSYNQKVVGGTVMAIGQIKTDVSDDLFDREQVVSDAIEFIESEHPDISIDQDSFDLSDLDQGKIGFAVSISRDALNRGSVASTSDDFKIVEAQNLDLKKKTLK